MPWGRAFLVLLPSLARQESVPVVEYLKGQNLLRQVQCEKAVEQADDGAGMIYPSDGRGRGRGRALLPSGGYGAA